MHPIRSTTYRQVRDGPHSYLVVVEELPSGGYKATVSGRDVTATGDSVDAAVKNIKIKLIEGK